IDVHPSSGSSFGIQRWATRQGGFWDTQKWSSGNFNGVGGDDLANVFNDYGYASMDIHASTGSSFGIQRWATRRGGFWDTQRWLSGDIDGDGKADMVNVFNDWGKTSFDIHYAAGNNSFTSSRWKSQLENHSDSYKWLIGDVDGDGHADLIKVFNDAGQASIDVYFIY
ncbi:MAG: VCBS repeat-containing protein, partial [Spirochaetes bacterium]|nr:VCBS repeat-containing protein [Spirochaetota bacterium]